MTAGALPCAPVWNVSDSRRAQSAAFGHGRVRLRQTVPVGCSLQSTQHCTRERPGGHDWRTGFGVFSYWKGVGFG